MLSPVRRPSTSMYSFLVFSFLSSQVLQWYLSLVDCFWGAVSLSRSRLTAILDRFLSSLAFTIKPVVYSGIFLYIGAFFSCLLDVFSYLLSLLYFYI